MKLKKVDSSIVVLTRVRRSQEKWGVREVKNVIKRASEIKTLATKKKS
jgi:hypothetical protein